jgi:hypothetical protein
MGMGDKTEITKVEEKKASFLSTRKTAMQAETDRIQRARDNTVQRSSDLKKINQKLFDVTRKDGTTVQISVDQATAQLESAAKQVQQHKADVAEELEDAAKRVQKYKEETAAQVETAIKGLRESTENIVESVAKKQGTHWYTRPFGITLSSDKLVGEKAKKDYSTSTSTSKRRIRDLVKTLAETQEHETPTPAATQSTTPKT